MFDISIIMPLSPLSTENLHKNLTALKAFIQKHIRHKGYMIVIKWIKQNHNSKTFKITLIYDCGHKLHTSTAIQYLNIKSQSIECPFQCYKIKRFNKKDVWELHVTHSGYNYAKFYNPAAHATHCVDNYTDEQMAEIKCGIHTGLHINQILSQMCIHNSDILFKPIKIQNTKSMLHWYNLNWKTSIQTLIYWFTNSSDWYMIYKKNNKNQITHLFINHQNSHQQF